MTNRLELAGHVDWKRVSPRYVVVDVVGYVIFAVIAIAIACLPVVISAFTPLWTIPAAVAVIMIIVIAFVPRRVRSIGYQLRDDDLLFRRGLLFQTLVSVPPRRMQLAHVNRGPVSGALGLSHLRFVTGAASRGVSIPGLPLDDAEALRDRLVALAESR